MERFHIIYDRYKLPEIIEFIGEGFAMESQQRYLFESILKESPDDTPLAAICETNGVITQAILLISQPFYLNDETVYCLNLSCWYARPEHRGIKAVLFMKNVLKSLNSYILTDYTPSEEASAILKSLGFVDMHVVNHRLGLTRNLKIIYRLGAIRKYFLNSRGRQFSKFTNISIKFQKTAGPANLWWIIKIKKGFLSARILNLYIGNLDEFKQPSALDIILLMFRFRAVSINFFLYSATPNGPGRHGPWLIKQPKSTTYVIPPTGSELKILSIL